MAKQSSIIKIEGTLGGVTFYKTKDGYLAKGKSSISANRIKSDPRFVRTRENNAEFRNATKAGKLLRDSARPLMVKAHDYRVSSRLTQLMSQVLRVDTTSFRGCRTPVNGLNTPNGKAMLKMFNFNKASLLGSVLFKPFTVNTLTGLIEIADLDPASDVLVPEGATHFSLYGGMMITNFSVGSSDLKLTNVVNSSITAAPATVTLTPVALPAGTGIKLYFLKIEFFQEVNAVQYSLRNGEFNALEIVEVA
jgi:hypothetical protein